MQKPLFPFLCFFALFLQAGSLQADGIRLSFQSARQIGMAHTGTALEMGVSAIYFNPGSLSFAERTELQLGATFYLPKTSFQARFPSLYQVEMESRSLTPFYLYAGFKKANWKKWYFGVGINSPFGGGSAWPNDWIGNTLVQEFFFSMFTIQPTVSYRINQNMGIGLGIRYGLGNLVIRKALPTSGPGGNLSSLEYIGDGMVFGINAGWFFQLEEGFSAGINYQSPLRMNVKRGRARFNVPSSLEDLYPSTRFSTEFVLPAVLNIGIGFEPRERLQVAFDVNWTNWAVYDTLKLDFEDETLTVLDTGFVQNYANSMSFRMGGEYTFNDRVQMRLGVMYDLTPVQNEFVNPEFPEGNRVGATAGLGIRLSRQLMLDLAYQYTYSGERTGNFSPASFRGTYLSYQLASSIGIKYVFF
ncbi:MAG: outer membrane protein transport protein [Bacteroidota bacterium]